MPDSSMHKIFLHNNTENVFWENDNCTQQQLQMESHIYFNFSFQKHREDSFHWTYFI